MKFHFSLPRLLLLAIFASSLSSVAIAQDRDKADRKLALRILAVGDSPPFEQKIVDGPNGRVRLQQPPPAGSLPPFEVQMADKEGAEEGDPARLTLNQLSGILAVRGGLVPLHESGDGGLNPKPWHFIKYPSGARAALAILWRDPTVKKWDKARSITIRDDLTAFGAGKVRIINVSGADVGLDIDGKRGKLSSGKLFMHTTKGGKAHLKINLKLGNGWTEVADQAVNQGVKERTNVIIYRADGESPRRPVKAVVLREVARTPVVPKKRRP